MEERRKKRSEQLETALRYQLKACVDRAGISAMVVSDLDGFLIASSKIDTDYNEELAANLPLIMNKKTMCSPLMRVVPFNDSDITLYLCAVGDGKNVDENMKIASDGVTRILN